MYRVALVAVLLDFVLVGANAATYTVLKIADIIVTIFNAEYILREAIAAANATADHDLIEFNNFAVTLTNGGNSNGTSYVVNIFAPTAANVSIADRVFTPDGRGLRNAFVTVTESTGNPQNVRTGTFGFFRIAEKRAGQIHIFEVTAKSHRLIPQLVINTEDLTDLKTDGTEISLAEADPRLCWLNTNRGLYKLAVRPVLGSAGTPAVFNETAAFAENSSVFRLSAGFSEKMLALAICFT